MFYLWRKVMPAYKWHNRKGEQDESKFDGFVGSRKKSSLQFNKPRSHKHGGGGGNDSGGRANKHVFKCIFHKKKKKKKKHRNGSSGGGGGGKK